MASGDLFSEKQPVFSVTDLTRTVRALIEDQMGVVWVEGEVSNLRRQSSGHQYFTLKDDRSQLSCVWFYRGGSSLRQVQLVDGMQVQVRGQMTVYEARGQYQLNVNLVQAGGVGLLQAKFEALKRKLQAEGFFAPERKRPLPTFPKSIGVVTSPTGAAIRDMLNILHRRAPWIEIIIHPVRVQGEGAAREIAAAIAEFNQAEATGLPPVEVIIVARGGGSVEDLWAFNEEIVAREIFASDIPVISAVGHEIDFTIADFVADLRAPTPSAAAELVAPDSEEIQRRLSQIKGRLGRRVLECVSQWKQNLNLLAKGTLMKEPQRRLQDLKQELDIMEECLARGAREGLNEWRSQLSSRLSVLRHHRPDQVIQMRRHDLAAALLRMREKAAGGIQQRKDALDRFSALLRVLSPESILNRGYTITMSPKGEVLDSVGQLAAGMKIVTRFKDGSANSVVE
jgi:exodeoxyribonuclease VII large subunit